MSEKGLENTTASAQSVDSQVDKRTPWEFRVNLVLPKLIGYLELSEILKCRLVSKTWLLHIDNLLSKENPVILPYNEELYNSTLHHRLPSSFLQEEQCNFKKIMNHYHFRRSNRLNGFTRQMVSQLKSKRNPFIGRYVSLGLISRNIEEDPQIAFRNIPEYWINVEKFIYHWGQNIWYLQFGDDGYTHTPAEFYLLLQKSLENLPNLKFLDIASLHLNNSVKSSEPLSDAITDKPLPALPNLETVLLPTSGKMPEQIQHTLIRTYARQLKNLRFGLNSFAGDYPHVITKLEELTVFEVGSNDKLSQVLNLFTIPLRKLVLDLRDTPTKTNHWSVEHILGLLQDLPVKVAILKLGNDVPLQENHVDSLPIRDQFKVETLHTLEMSHCPGTSYNFLWCLPALRNLHIEYNPFVQGDLKGNLVKLIVGTASNTLVMEEDQEVDIREFMENGRDLYESNVWCVVPSLEVLSYTRLHWCWWPSQSVYRREIYEWRKRRNLGGRRVKRSKSRSWRRQQWDKNLNKAASVTSGDSMASVGDVNMRRLHSCESLTRIHDGSYC